MILGIIQLVGIFLVGWFGSANIAKAFYKQDISSGNFMIASIGLVMIFTGIIF